MSLSTTQYGYIIDPMVPFTDDKGKTIKNGYIRVFMAGTSTPVLTYRNYDGATNQEKIELDNSGRVMHNVIGSKGSLYKVVVYNILHSQENPLLTVDKIAVLGASINASGATIVTGLDSVTVQEENFLKATVEGTGVELALDPTEVTSEVSTIGAAETAAPDYVVPLLDKTGTGDSKKISLANLFKFALDRISRLATTITSFASGDFFAVSNTTDGTRKMATSTLLELTAQNALADNVAPKFIENSTNAKKGYPYVWQGKLYVAKEDYTGVWDSSKFTTSPLDSLLELIYKGDAIGFRAVPMNRISYTISNVEGSGTSATCNILISSNTILWQGGYVDLPATTLTGVAYNLAGVFVKIKKRDKTFVSVEVFVMSSYGSRVSADPDHVYLPLFTLGYGGEELYRSDELLVEAYTRRTLNSRSFNCISTKKIDVTFKDIAGVGDSRTCTVKFNAYTMILALGYYIEIPANTEYANVPYSYGGLYFKVPSMTIEAYRLGSSLPTLADNQQIFPILQWFAGEVIYSCDRGINEKDVREISNDVVYDDVFVDFSESETASPAIGEAVDLVLNIPASLRGDTIGVHIENDALRGFFGLSWNGQATSAPGLVRWVNFTSDMTLDIDVLVPSDANSLHLWTGAGNVTAAGDVQMSSEGKCLNSRVKDLEDNVPHIVNPIVQVPPKMYVVCNDISSSSKPPRNYSIKMYVDHAISGVSEHIKPKFGDGKITKDLYGQYYSTYAAVNSSTENTTNDVETKTITDNIVLSDAEKYPISFQLVSTRNKATKDKKCRLLCIGDSTTQGYLAYEGMPYPTAPKCYYAWIKALFESDKLQAGSGYFFESLGNIITGSLTFETFDIDFGGVQESSVKAYACGMGGSKTSDWLAPTFTSGGVTYTNPFYDPVAQKFSLEYWVENYRTLIVNGDGTTTRCTNENKGALVEDVNDYNVCEPTHVVIQLGYNQVYGTTGTTRTNYLNNLHTIIDTIITEYPSVKVLLSLPDCACSFNLDKFREYLTQDDDMWKFDPTLGNCKSYHDSFAFMNKDLMNLAGEYDGKVIYVPTFFAVPSVLQGVIRQVPDMSFVSNKNPLSNGLVMCEGNPLLHPNNAGHASIAYAIYSVLKNDLLGQS